VQATIVVLEMQDVIHFFPTSVGNSIYATTYCDIIVPPWGYCNLFSLFTWEYMTSQTYRPVHVIALSEQALCLEGAPPLSLTTEPLWYHQAMVLIV
jgi:hypothetical protein